MRPGLMLSTLSCGVALAAMIALAPPAIAYGTYSNSNPGNPPTHAPRTHTISSPRCQDDTKTCVESYGNCKTCHGNFRATDKDDDDPALKDPYKSPVDGKQWRVRYKGEWVVGLHDIHVKVILHDAATPETVCGVCHFGSLDPTTGEPVSPVRTNVSNGVPGSFEPIGCVGCHGRHEDQGTELVKTCTVSQQGECRSLRGAGLRQHHVNAGVTECKTCHLDADPKLYTPKEENLPPPYYQYLAMDPCKGEDYAGGPTGLDNDGDGRYDWLDRDCRPVGPRK